jgi:SWIM zinc finger
VTTYSRDQVLAMAPDPAAAKAGQGQASRSRWSGLGQDAQAVWGQCGGSGAAPYRTQAALADGATGCSCPSRKFPCKHAIGLLLLHADGAVPDGERPDWASEWLAARVARAARPARPERPADAPADPQAAARRAASREAKVDAGVDQMRRWLADLARGGLGAAQSQPWAWWDAQARRMIDAQARGLASHVRRMASIAATGGLHADWPDRLTDQLGSAHLLCAAWTHRASLPEPTGQALRVRLGYAASTEDVTKTGDRVTDCWAVLGQRLGEEGNLRSLQQWIYGERTGEVVTFLSFAAAAQPLPPGLPPGQRTTATLARYPGTRPARVLIVDRVDSAAPLGPLSGEADWDGAMARVADLLCVDPWADVLPMAVRGLTVLPADSGLADGASPADRARRWLLRDRAGRAMPVEASQELCWSLLAISAGRPVDVAGEWDGYAFLPQAAAPAGRPGRLLP